MASPDQFTIEEHPSGCFVATAPTGGKIVAETREECETIIADVCARANANLVMRANSLRAEIQQHPFLPSSR